MKLGVIGYGNRIHGVINSCLREVEPDIKIAGIVDPDEAGVRERLAESDKEAPFFPSLEKLVLKAKPDALAIGTRCNLHAPYAVEAEKYNLPIYLEKPVAVTMEQAVSLEKAFENSAAPVLVSFPLRVSPLCRLAHEYIQKNSTGNPEHIAAYNYVSYGTVYFERPYSDYSVTQGLFLQKATHDFDYISMLMGSSIKRIAAMHTRGGVFGGDKPEGLVCSKCPEIETCLESPKNRKRNHSGGRLSDHTCLFGKDCGNPKDGMNEDSSSALLEFDNGRHGAYTQVFYSRRNASARGAVVSGYNGTIRFDWYKNSLEWVRHHAPFTSVVKAGEGLSHFGGDIELAQNFIDMVNGKAGSPAPVQSGIQSVYACLAAKESAGKNTFARVRQVGQSGN
jgi:predicted dehydrogenase